MCEDRSVQDILQHIAGPCKKAGRHINALSRLAKVFDLPPKLVLMQTSVLTHFNFLTNYVAFFQIL